MKAKVQHKRHILSSVIHVALKTNAHTIPKPCGTVDVLQNNTVISEEKRWQMYRKLNNLQEIIHETRKT